VCARTACACA